MGAAFDRTAIGSGLALPSLTTDGLTSRPSRKVLLLVGEV
jgi:hypothetical protein